MTNYKLNVKKLSIFNEVVKTGSITKAARILGMSQPAVSSAIASLESELGFMLFRRLPSGTELTPEALHLAEGVRKVLSASESLQELATELQCGRAGKLQVGCLPGLSSTLLPRVIADYLRDFGGTKISLQTADSQKIIDWVRTGQLDIGVVEIPRSSIDLKIISYSFNMVCAIPPGSALQNNEQITPEDLDQHDMVTLEENHLSTQQLHAAFRKFGKKPQVVAEAHLFPSVLAMVDEGLGCALVDPVTGSEFLRRWDSRLTLKPFLPETDFYIAIILPTNKTQSRQCRNFSEHLQKALSVVEQQYRS